MAWGMHRQQAMEEVGSMITGNGRADADNPKIIQQMQGKHPVEYWPHASLPIGEEPDLTSNIAAVVLNTKPPS